VGLRAIPSLERAPILPWLRGLNETCLSYWQSGALDPDCVGALAAAGMVESLLCGVTCVADQHYFFPGAGRSLPFIEATIAAALDVGIRLNAGRGTITFGRARGGSASDELTQPLDEVLRHANELIDDYHDPTAGAQIRIDLAPCGVHVDLPELFREFAALAVASDGVRLHTHLYEVVDTAFAQDRYETTPWRILEANGWATDRAWLAHVNDPPVEEIPEFAAAGVGIVHLIAPDLKMGWGLAPLREFLDAGCRVGFGTTGSASNDGANQLADLRLAGLAHRQAHRDPDKWPTARELLRMATTGSAAIVGRPDTGHIDIGALADIACWDFTTIDRVGIHDPLAGLLYTGLSDRATLVMVGGRIVVRDGRCVTIDERALAARANALIRRRTT
jgi:cytosine/adenosine deaminase-related metal-dependent hydrolase